MFEGNKEKKETTADVIINGMEDSNLPLEKRVEELDRAIMTLGFEERDRIMAEPLPDGVEELSMEAFAYMSEELERRMADENTEIGKIVKARNQFMQKLDTPENAELIKSFEKEESIGYLELTKGWLESLVRKGRDKFGIDKARQKLADLEDKLDEIKGQYSMLNVIEGEE